MPVYEYRCNGCGERQSRLIFSWTPSASLTCNSCDGIDLTRLVSGFSFHRSWGDSLNWMPDNAAADLDNSHIGSIDSHMGRMGRQWADRLPRSSTNTGTRLPVPIPEWHSVVPTTFASFTPT